MSALAMSPLADAMREAGLSEAGDIFYWPTHRLHPWSVSMHVDPLATPSPMARAQSLYDAHRKLVAS